jgi:16S rRNA processing protein RimM
VPDEPAARGHLLVGRVGRAVGLRGEVEVLVLSDAPDRFGPGSSLLLGDALHDVTVRSSRRQKDRTIVTFDGFGDRTAAERLRGAALYIPPDAARSLGEGEYWDHDLIGCTVVTVDGDVVGKVTDVLHQPSGELLEVDEHLIPLISDVVRAIVPGERITIDPLPGLLEGDERRT